jgi:hypothetical protein
MLSSTVIASSVLVSWNVRTTRSAAIACAGRPAISRPSKTTRPESPRVNPATMSKRVDLPAPFGPISAVIDRGSP